MINSINTSKPGIAHEAHVCTYCITVAKEVCVSIVSILVKGLMLVAVAKISACAKFGYITNPNDLSVARHAQYKLEMHKLLTDTEFLRHSPLGFNYQFVEKNIVVLLEVELKGQISSKFIDDLLCSL